MTCPLTCSPWLSVCASSLTGWNLVMDLKEPHAKDDPRIQGYPCFSNHDCKMRQNQHAVWQACSRCGLRTSCTCKKDSKGDRRHMGPDPNLLKVILEEFEKTTPPERMAEAIIMGRLMEVKGKLLQTGAAKGQQLYLTVEEYRKRLGELSPKKTPWAKALVAPQLTEEIKDQAVPSFFTR